MVRRMFDEVYYAMEALADKTPDTVADGYKVRRINEVLQQVQESLTYSDILIALKWYKVLPR